MVKTGPRLMLFMLLASALLGLTTAAPAPAAERVYLPKGFAETGLTYLYRPRAISLGSTGVVKNLKWRRWNSSVAVGHGKGVPYSSSVSPDASRRATVRLDRRRRCGERQIYTRVRYRVFGLAFSDHLTCSTGVHA